jgi:hypothetical protein
MISKEASSAYGLSSITHIIFQSHIIRMTDDGSVSWNILRKTAILLRVPLFLAVVTEQTKEIKLVRAN